MEHASSGLNKSDRMNLVLLIPAVISLVLVIRGRIQTAFLSVYLPALLLFPEEYAVRLPHLPTLSAAEFVLLPIGFAGLVQLLRNRSFAIMDVLVFAYFVSSTLSEVLREPVMNDGLFVAFGDFSTLLLPYVVGRLLIEPGLRLATVRRIVLLFLITLPFGAYEYRMGQNIYGMIGQKVLSLEDTHRTVVIRDGRGRFAGAFTIHEIAGIALGMTVALNGWLVFLNRRNGVARLGTFFATLEKYHIPGIALLFAIWMTQSRGPILAVGAAYLFLQIPKFRNTRLASLGAALIIAIGFLAAYQYFTRYTNVTYAEVKNEQQLSALYRREMFDNYRPIAEEGGLLGWGLLHIPHVGRQTSIDNEYLFAHLARGMIGYILLLIIVAENLRTLVLRSWSLRSIEDRAFAFSMLGAMAVLWITLLTVFMGEQLPQFAFLLIGWSQSIRDTAPATEAVLAEAPNPRLRLKRVFS